MRLRRSARSRQGGAAVIEFALTLPLLVPLMLFMIEYGHYFWVTLNAVEAAKVGLAATISQNNSTSASSCLDPTAGKVTNIETKGHDAALQYLTDNTASLRPYATVTVTCVAAPVNGVTLTNPSWQIVVKMDFPPVIGWRLPWLKASTTLSGGITYSTPALIRTI